MLASSARAFLRRCWPPRVARDVEARADGFEPERWQAIAGLGWPGLILPEAYGGSGRDAGHLVVLAEELGRAACSSPLLASTTLVALPVAWAGDGDVRARWLPGLASGALVGAPALLGEGARDEWDERGRSVVLQNGWLTGTAPLVPYASVADVLLVAARDAGGDLALVLVDTHASGIGMRRHAALGADPLWRVTFDTVEAERAAVLATGEHARRVLDRAVAHATVAGIAYAVGLGEAALELSVRHANDRVQFGRPIGAFQAVAHRCVDIRADVDACRLLAWQAAWSLTHRVDATLEVSAAKAYANDALRRIFVNAHQVHGAIGFAMEHDLQLFTRRAKAFELTHGSADVHRQRVADGMGL